MKYFTLFSLTALLCHIVLVENAKILAIFPLVQKSHYVMFRKLLEELAIRGHTVDILGGIPPSSGNPIPGLTYVDLPDLPMPDIPPFTINGLRQFTVKFALKFMFTIGSVPTCRDLFSKTEAVKKLVASNKEYDLLIIEIFVCDCYFGFAHRFKAPIVSLISSTDLPWGSSRIGNPDNPAYIPNYFQPYIPHKSLYDRVWNTVSYLHTRIGHWWYIGEQNKISKEFFGADMPDLNDVIANISLLLVNSHFSMNMARPKVPNVIEVGGLHLENPKKLEKKLDDFIGKDRFIYFSLGTIANANSFDPVVLKNIIDTFSELKYKVLWKIDGTKLPESIVVPPNVLAQSWMPQIDILCHPNRAVFITHTGLMGTQEAIHCGVPMLCIPLFADQYQNCQNMIDREIGKTVNVETLTKEEFRSVLNELLEDPKYMKNAKKLSEEFKDRPESPLETAIYWIEYVLRHKGAPQLRSISASLKWYQYHLIDVICVFLISVIVALIVVYLTMRFLLQRLRIISRRRTDSEIKKRS